MTKRILSLALAAGLLLSGCLKDKDIEDRKYGHNGVEDVDLIAITNAPESRINMFASAEDTSVTLVTLRLHAESVATRDIQVRLAFDDEMVIDAGLDVLPSDRYTVPNLTVTIPKGQREFNFNMTVVPDDVANGHFGLALRIDTVLTPGYTVRALYDEVLVSVGVRNEYDGVYQATGVIGGHPTVGGPFDRAIDLETAGPNSVVFYQPNVNGLFTGVPVMATVNNDNTVTIDPLPGFPAVFVPAGGVNTYDPGTRTFNLRFNWPGAPTREATNTFVYTGPRP